MEQTDFKLLCLNDFDKIDLKCKSFENKGNGAGGKNTNLKGKSFENKTDFQIHLGDYNKTIINSSKYGYFLQKINEDVYKTFMLQSGFKIFFKKCYDIDFFRFPDEAFIVQDNEVMNIYIIEKKEQSVDGSVETKLWSCPSLKREYEIILEDKFKELGLKFNIKVHYILCVSKFLEDKFKMEKKNLNDKFKILKRILDENDIKVLYGDSESYFEELKTLINF